MKDVWAISILGQGRDYAQPIHGHLRPPLKSGFEIGRMDVFYALRAFAISGATDTVLTPLSRVSVASTASTPER